MKSDVWIKVQVICVKQDANRHALKDEDVYIEEQYIHRKSPIAIFPADPKYWPPMSKGCLACVANTIPTAHSVEELVEMFSGEN